jgi:hypothetical protein
MGSIVMAVFTRRAVSVLVGAVLATVAGNDAGAAADPARELIGKTATLSLQPDEEAELDPMVAGLGYSAIQPPRNIPGEGGPTFRLEVLSGVPAGESTLVVWRLEKPLDRVNGEWKVTAAVRAKIGSEAAFTQNCPGNAKGKGQLTFIFHESGNVGQPAKDITAAFRLDRQSGKLEKIGKPPACTVTEDTFSEE